MKSQFNLNMHDYIHRPEGKLFYNQQMFGRIASKYDFINRALSFGRDSAWKNQLVKELPEAAAPACLDIACGTGDITFLLAAKYPAGKITGIDITEQMLNLAESRVTSHESRITFDIGDMCQMDFPANSFDIVTGGYALRNAPDLEGVLAEIMRVMKPGATAAFLDFSKSPNRFWQKIENLLLSFWVALWGILIHRNPRIYAYLPESLKQYPDNVALKKLITQLGFVNLHSRKHFFGFTETIFFQKS